MFKWSVKHLWKGEYNVANFNDYYDATEYAARWGAFVVPFGNVCLNGNSSTSQPLSMTDEGESSAQAKTAT